MPSYGVSSTIFGSIRIILTSSGVARASSDTSIELTKLDLPEPVEPATSRCGIFARFHEMYSPSMSLPSAITSGWWSRRVDGSVSTSARRTISRSVLGTSMPTADLPGIGASIRTLSVATA